MAVPPFDHAATSHSLPHAYWMARAAALAYRARPAVEALARTWGFDEVRHFESRHPKPFPIEDTRAYVMASDRMIVAGFRGTDAGTIRGWLSDTATPPVPGPGGKGYVHHGFDRAVRSVYPELRDAVLELRTDQQTVWLTGHGLGGALAMLAGAHLYFEAPRLLPDGVYTYGQPRTCERLLAAAYREPFRHRSHRFVNNEDVVPRMPPGQVYTHVETLRRFDADGRLHEGAPPVGGVPDQGVQPDPFAPGTDGLRDHHVEHYLAAFERSLAATV
ncbi:lipase family protein [Kitasatospora camelliae]|uniref:Lipase family protein n=1 Tax=Kitasatospora camelliae TaxID=3156397 RepID=A0AAU8K300_9ACTN